MTHQPLEVLLRTYDNKDHWERVEDMPMGVDDDPTGWGALPWAPTDRDRKSNEKWDSLYGAWREEYWETVPYTDGYGQVGTREQLKDEKDRAWYDDRKK